MTPYGVTDAVESQRSAHAPAHTMTPAAEDLPDVLPTDRLNGRGMATPVWRDELRRIPNVRNGFTVVGALPSRSASSSPPRGSTRGGRT